MKNRDQSPCQRLISMASENLTPIIGWKRRQKGVTWQQCQQTQSHQRAKTATWMKLLKVPATPTIVNIHRLALNSKANYMYYTKATTLESITTGRKWTILIQAKPVYNSIKTNCWHYKGIISKNGRGTSIKIASTTPKPTRHRNVYENTGPALVTALTITTLHFPDDD